MVMVRSDPETPGSRHEYNPQIMSLDEMEVELLQKKVQLLQKRLVHLKETNKDFDFVSQEGCEIVGNITREFEKAANLT